MTGHTARCEARGVRRDVSLFLLGDQGVMVGDHVLVHVGYAIRTMTAADAHATWSLFDEITTRLDGAEA